eukprot:TRINITY_DN3353_c0_g1_i2.p10 TRINITY_DN3353_c0_g1~~TRINITY_DN3353_c0_g1_i2.p10  ORF type:complete len:133 (+),score=17.92 TRINITY_DN3353_c0_g1_i2:106-504(+)
MEPRFRQYTTCVAKTDQLEFRNLLRCSIQVHYTYQQHKKMSFDKNSGVPNFSSSGDNIKAIRSERQDERVKLNFPPFATASAAFKAALQKVQVPEFVKEQKPIFAPCRGMGGTDGEGNGNSVAFAMAHFRCV